MLLGNKKKLIETHLENVLWGNVKVIHNNRESNWHFTDGEIEKFLANLQRWSKLYFNTSSSEEFETLTETLYENITEYRLMGLVQGKYEDIDQTVETLKSENSQLAEKLSQAYIPSQDSKVGTN